MGVPSRRLASSPRSRETVAPGNTLARAAASGWSSAHVRTPVNSRAAAPTIASGQLCFTTVPPRLLLSRVEDAEVDRHAGADLLESNAVDPAAAQREVDREMVAYLPDRTDQAGTDLRRAVFSFIEELSHRSHRPAVRAFDDHAVGGIDELLARHRHLSVEVQRKILPSLRDDQGKARARAGIVARR